MGDAEYTCRTCGKSFEHENNSELCPLFTASEYQNELKMIISEFEIWKLDISENDGLPQKICLTCFDSFCQIHNFRIMCEEAQTNFNEMCTGLDIIINTQADLNGDFENDFPEDHLGEQVITIQEHYRFPREERPKLELAEDEDKKQKHSLETSSVNVTGLKDEVEDMDETVPEFKEHRCEYCMDIVSFDDPDQLNDHYNALHCTDFPYICPKCDKSYDTRYKRNLHAKTHFRLMVECEICGKKVRGGKVMLAYHNELHHVEKDRECVTCGKIFPRSNLKSFNYHMTWHDDAKLHKCKYCEKKFVQITHLVVHEKSHTGACIYQCCECGSVFANNDQLLEHNKTHEETYLPSKEKSRDQQTAFNSRTKFCEICQKYFRSAMNLRLHNYKIHGASPTQEVKEIIKLKRNSLTVPGKPYKCSKCSESFLLHTQLVMHLKKHDENRPFKCPTCPKRFKLEKYLKVHIDTVHLKKKDHQCVTCGSMFTSKPALDEHIASRHKDTKEYKCEVCEKRFACDRMLKNHMLRHKEIKPFECTLCNKKFRQSFVLKAHFKGHQKRQAKLFSKLTDVQKEEFKSELMK